MILARGGGNSGSAGEGHFLGHKEENVACLESQGRQKGGPSTHGVSSHGVQKKLSSKKGRENVMPHQFYLTHWRY